MPKKIGRLKGQKLKMKGFRVTIDQDMELAQSAEMVGLDEAEMIRRILAQAGAMTLEDKVSVHKAAAKIAEEVG